MRGVSACALAAKAVVWFLCVAGAVVSLALGRAWQTSTNVSAGDPSGPWDWFAIAALCVSGLASLLTAWWFFWLPAVCALLLGGAVHFLWNFSLLHGSFWF